MKENKAEGRANAPVLFVMLSKPSAGMLAWFWKQVHAAGIKKTQVRIVYMLDEPPAGSGNKGLKAQFRASAERYEREMKASKPKVVIPMGPDAAYSITGLKGKKLSIFDIRGYLIRKDQFLNVPRELWLEVGKYKNASKKTGAKKGDPKMKWVTQSSWGVMGEYDGVVIPTFTLDYVRLKRFAVKPAFKEDLCRARRVVTDSLVEIDKDMVYYCDPSRVTDITGEFAKAKTSLADIEWGEIIAIDIETHGVDNEVIDLVSFSDGFTTASLDWSEPTRKYVEKLFKLPGRIFAVHNSPFDIPRLIDNGVKINQKVLDTQIFDTMFASVVVQPDLHKALGRIASVYLDITAWKWPHLVLADPRFYSAKDSFVTAWLAKSLIAVMKSLGCWNLYMGQGGHPGPGCMATIPELTLMSKTGIRVNTEYAVEWCEKLEKRQLRYLKLWTKHFPTISPTSNPQLGKFFYGTWGLPVQRTAEDGISVDELALVKLSAFVEQQRGLPDFDGPWQEDPRANKRSFELLMRIRDNNKTLGTYVQPVMLSGEQWVHPQYLPVSKDEEMGGNKNKTGEMHSKGNTATGRFVSYKPNIQNQPKKTRVLYIPDTPDMCFVQGDYKSAELFILAGKSGDRRLMEDLFSSDMHGRNAERLGVIRDTAKNVTYASQYLASANKQSEMILEQSHMWVSPEECQMISEGIWGYYTDATAYKYHLIDLCEKKKYITNAFGRVRFFHDGRAPAAVDFIPQSEVADILWCVLKPVAELARRYGGRVVTTVHDSIVACVPSAVRDEFSWEMKKVMEQRFDNIAKGFYIPVDLEVGEAGAPWNALKKLKAA